MNNIKSQHGFSAVAVLLILVIVGLVGVIGWRVFDTQQSLKPSSSATVKQQAAQGSDSAALNSKADVEDVQKQLDSVNVDSDLDATALDSDLDSLL